MCINIELNSCCGCMDLKTGSFVIGYTGLTFSGVSILYIIFAVFIAPEAEVAEHSFTGDFIRIILYISLGLCILQFLFSCCLVIGVHTNGRGCIKAFIIYINVLIGYEIVQFVVIIFTLNFLGLLFNLPIFMLLLYIVGVVNSYYKELETAVPVLYAANGVVVGNCATNNAPDAVNYPTVPAAYGSPEAYTNAVNGPVGYGSPNDVYTSAVNGPLGYSQPNGVYPAVPGAVNYGSPKTDYIATAPDNYSYNGHIDTKL